MHGERGRVERAATSVLWSALCAARASLVRSCGALSVSKWVRRGVRVRVGCCAVGRLAYSFYLFAIARMFDEVAWISEGAARSLQLGALSWARKPRLHASPVLKVLPTHSRFWNVYSHPTQATERLQGRSSLFSTGLLSRVGCALLRNERLI